ncbi:unnamed protein product [Penicillium salamii]|uniref:NADP-dependent oxidoreductase domain-containing protein n=1 Tax=Penicillium salamii TaxID=1612424 RepID=A0A9W4NND4_9EURO|nr:unnamed protein product [Penicillium salamii]
MPFPTRSLGRNGPQVPAVGLGLMSLGSIYGSAGSLEDKVAFLEHAHSIGARFWDTADIYFDSEDAVGEWIRRSQNRDDIFLATKFALQYDIAAGTQTIHSDPDYVRTACDKSLQRLGVDTIDLYYCHPISAYQVEYSPFALEIEISTILETCRELGIAIIAYSPIGRGILTGHI